MEFKVFKNETGKILKEYWVTPSEWEALDKTTVQEGDIYHRVGILGADALSADVNASLTKADAALQKPSTTVTTPSFLKLNADGSVSVDSSKYATLALNEQNEFSSQNVFNSMVSFDGVVNFKTASETIFNTGSGLKIDSNVIKLKKSLQILDDIDNPTAKLFINYCNPDTAYPSAQLQYVYNSLPEYNGKMGVEFVQADNGSTHASLGLTQWYSSTNNVESYQSICMDLERTGTASIMVYDQDKSNPNTPLTTTTYRFNKNNKINTVATIEDIGEQTYFNQQINFMSSIIPTDGFLSPGTLKKISLPNPTEASTLALTSDIPIKSATLDGTTLSITLS